MRTFFCCILSLSLLCNAVEVTITQAKAMDTGRSEDLSAFLSVVESTTCEKKFDPVNYIPSWLKKVGFALLVRYITLHNAVKIYCKKYVTVYAL